LEEHWTNLGSADLSRVSRSLYEIVAAAKQSVPLLKGRLRASSPPSAEQEKAIAKRITELDSDEFETRMKAMGELEKLSEMALPALRKAQKEPSSLEAGRRLDWLVSRIEESPRRELHGVEALERIGTREAKQVLEALARGAPEARLTQEAKASLQRLGRRTATGKEPDRSDGE
jgi:hypothetical protein